ncbi:FecR family protein [Bacteroides sp. 519]|uniref:FecR family protein n=1 Tax=Bacteroides sp. 519 TaxID=2302937 RepID=UPI0013D84646|nr:FecR domain-containing protein [Bacteroides sp. 519]NDV58287.1 FecR family protein [Bacteroides sp. 519]
MDEYILKYMQEELTQTERVELLRKFDADESLKKEFMDLQNMKALLNIAPQVQNKEEAKEAYAGFTRKVKRRKIRRIIQLASGYAATVALIVFATWWITNHLSAPSPIPVANTNTLFVPAGQRAQITLQDGTTVWLNAQSTLTYPSHFFTNERKVSISGEAYFEVAKDKSKPFIVDAGGNQIKVLGTQFNVYCYPNAEVVQTSLLEGSIEMYPQNSTEGITLKPNQQITISDNKAVVSTIKNFEAFLWKEGVYSFENERLDNIIKKLELYYDVNIIIRKQSLKDIRFTCKFRQREGINEILQILSKIHHFKISVNEETNTITLS